MSVNGVTWQRPTCQLIPKLTVSGCLACYASLLLNHMRILPPMSQPMSEPIRARDLSPMSSPT